MLTALGGVVKAVGKLKQDGRQSAGFDQGPDPLFVALDFFGKILSYLVGQALVRLDGEAEMLRRFSIIRSSVEALGWA